jgi:hypothetical protein
MAQVGVANTNRDGSGTIVDVCTGGANGTRIDDIDIVAAGTTTAGVVRLFISDGTNTWLWREILVTAATPSSTVAVWSATLRNLSLILKANWKLRASTHNAETFNILGTRAGDI